MATEELAGVGEELTVVGEDDGGDVGFAWLSTSRRRARRGKLQGGVHLHRKCTVSPKKLAGSSPEFSRCKSSVRVCGSLGYRNGTRLAALEEDAEEIVGSCLLAKIESDFYFPFF
jgi:hypothetical protein